jgi:geranylgeranylglycerol-phosphate geranylgeranyltransferase
VIGRRPALTIGLVAMTLAALASAVPFVRGTFGPAYLALVVPADLVMVAATARSFADPARGQRRLKLGMFLGAAAFVAGRAATLVGPTSP